MVNHRGLTRKVVIVTRSHGLVGLTLGAILTLSACSDGTGETGRPPPSSHTEAESADTSTAMWDPNSWEPAVDIEPITFTETEREQFRDEWLESNYAAHLDNEVPVEDLISWSLGHSDFDENVAMCLQSFGFPAEADAVGGIRFDPGVPESQDAALGLAQYTCAARYTLDPSYAQEWTEEQLGLIFDYWEQYYIPCMAAHGHIIDTTTQPSRESYVAAFHTADRISWWPNETSMTLPEAEKETLENTCPAYPPDNVFYGQ